MFTRTLFVVVAVVSFSITTAQAEDYTHAGSLEFTLGAGGAADDSMENGSASLNGSVGFFLAKPFEIGLRQSVSYSDSAFGDLYSGSTRVFGDFQLNFGRFAPFIGANVGYIYGDGVVDTFEAAPEIGVKWYVSKNGEAFLFAMAEYQFFFQESDNINDQFDNGQFVFSLGVGWRI